jgi:hypothetical protein
VTIRAFLAAAMFAAIACPANAQGAPVCTGNADSIGLHTLANLTGFSKPLRFEDKEYCKRAARALSVPAGKAVPKNLQNLVVFGALGEISPPGANEVIVDRYGRMHAIFDADGIELKQSTATALTSPHDKFFVFVTKPHGVTIEKFAVGRDGTSSLMLKDSAGDIAMLTYVQRTVDKASLASFVIPVSE